MEHKKGKENSGTHREKDLSERHSRRRHPSVTYLVVPVSMRQSVQQQKH